MAGGTVVSLVTGTALVESGLLYLKQLASGPALGLFRMGPETYNDIWNNFLKYRSELAADIQKIAVFDNSVVNGFPLSSAADVRVLANYHKNNYNTALGKADAE